MIVELIKEVEEKGKYLVPELALNYSLWCSPPRNIHREPAHVYNLNGAKAHMDFLINWLKNRKLWLDDEWKL